MKYVLSFLFLFCSVAYGTPSDIEAVRNYHEYLGSKDILQVSVEDHYACALRVDGKVICWGNDNQMVLGDSKRASTYRSTIMGIHKEIDYRSRFGPAVISGLKDIVFISTEEQYACAVDRGGNVYCWGYSGAINEFRKSPKKAFTPQRLEGITNTKALRTGEDVMCALKFGGEAMCWGWFHVKRDTETVEPKYFEAHHDAESLAVDFPGVCSVKDGKLLCKTNATKDWSSTPLRYAFDDMNNFAKENSSTNIREVVFGGDHACILKEDGYPRCFSEDRVALWINPIVEEKGKVVFEDEYELFPKVKGPYLTLSAGERSVCGILEKKREVECWGYEQVDFQLVKNESIDPVGLKGALSVSNSDNSVCAILKNKEVRCWGSGFDNEELNKSLRSL